MADQAVIAHLKLSDLGFGTAAERQDFMGFEDRLERAIVAAGAGEFDGNEFGGGECVWYMYGPDAEKLFRAVEPIVREAAVHPGSYVIMRRGAPGEVEKEEKIEL